MQHDMSEYKFTPIKRDEKETLADMFERLAREKHEAKYGVCGEDEFGVSYFRPECLKLYKQEN